LILLTSSGLFHRSTKLQRPKHIKNCEGSRSNILWWAKLRGRMRCENNKLVIWASKRKYQ
jgi:hypothetical protein